MTKIPLDHLTPLDGELLPHWDATVTIPRIGDRAAARRRIVRRQRAGYGLLFTISVALGLLFVVLP